MGLISKNLQIFKEEIGDAVAKHIDVAYAFQSTTDLPEGCEGLAQRTKPWGTGHAIWCCRNAVDSPFAVINADDYYGPKAFQLVYDHLTAPKTSDKPEYMMAGYILKNTLTDNGSVSRGVCVVENNQLVSIEENKKIEKGVVDGYKKNEHGVVKGYTKIEDKFVDAYLTKDGETVEEAKERLKKEK